MRGVRNEVFEALGTASMCWSEPPTGVFDSAQACKVGDDLMRKIEQVQAAENERLRGVIERLEIEKHDFAERLEVATTLLRLEGGTR